MWFDRNNNTAWFVSLCFVNLVHYTDRVLFKILNVVVVILQLNTALSLQTVHLIFSFKLIFTNYITTVRTYKHYVKSHKHYYKILNMN